MLVAFTNLDRVKVLHTDMALMVNTVQVCVVFSCLSISFYQDNLKNHLPYSHTIPNLSSTASTLVVWKLPCINFT